MSAKLTRLLVSVLSIGLATLAGLHLWSAMYWVRDDPDWTKSIASFALCLTNVAALLLQMFRSRARMHATWEWNWILLPWMIVNVLAVLGGGV